MRNFVSPKFSPMDNVSSYNYNLELVRFYVENTDRNIFLTGKAGTGKTTFLRDLAATTFKRMVILAPTGVAAINAGGMTIHSFFQMPFGPQIPDDVRVIDSADVVIPFASRNIKKIRKQKMKLIRSLDLIVIDEISMVRSDLLDAVDSVLRGLRHSDKPFGGVQMLMIGDIHQLAPVAKQEEWELLKPYYKSVYFFDSHVLQKSSYISVELDHVYRQADKDFVDLLNKVRDNRLDSTGLAMLNKCYRPDFKPDEEDGYVTLMTHNSQVDDFNEDKMASLDTKKKIFHADINGNFPENSYPTKDQLALKVNAQVMFVKNDPSVEKAYYNGKIGKVMDFDDDNGTVMVRCKDEIVKVTPVKWENVEYVVNEKTGEIEENVLGSFQQIPLKLAWAITIHKSQGLTFDKLVIDASRAFAHGQIYVALSRCTSLEGLVLRSKLTSRTLTPDYNISSFLCDMEKKNPDENQMQSDKERYEYSMLIELFDFKELDERLAKLFNVVFENKNIFDRKVIEKGFELKSVIYNNVVTVAQRFKKQIDVMVAQQSDVENNAVLQGRIIKGCEYFKKSIAVLEDIRTLALDTENVAVNNDIQEALVALSEVVFVKNRCLDIAGKGFDVKDYLRVRNKAHVDFVFNKKDLKRQELKMSKEDRLLYNTLMDWRKEKADDNNVTQVQILPKKVIEEIVRNKPVNRSDLKRIAKLGLTKIKKFGAEIINMVLSSQGFDVVEDKKKDIDSDILTDTENKTKELFDRGLTIEDVSRERGISKTTVENHICKIIQKGCMDVRSFVTDDKIELMKEYFVECRDPSLSAARDVLGEEYSYFELKAVLSALRAGKIIDY